VELEVQGFGVATKVWGCRICGAEVLGCGVCRVELGFWVYGLCRELD
jgi:hypothetical protein